MNRYVSDSISYKKNEKKTSKAVAEIKATELEFNTILNKVAGGEYIQGSLRGDEDGLLANDQVQKFISSEKMPLGEISPIIKAKTTIKKFREGSNSDEIKRLLENAEALKKMQKEAKAGKDGKASKDGKESKEGEKSKNRDTPELPEDYINRDTNWNDEDEVLDEEILNIIEERQERAHAPTNILKHVKMVENKVGFIQRKSTLKKGPGDVLKTEQAKQLSDLKKATNELWGTPVKQYLAQRIQENEYLTKRRYEYDKNCPRIVIVEDVSGSMRGSPEQLASATILAMLKQEAKGLVEIVDIILMGTHIKKLNLKENKILEYMSARNKNYDKATENQKAMVMAAEMVKDDNKAEVIVLTDGAYEINQQMYDTLRETKVKFHALLVKRQAESIKRLCEITGGKYEYIRSAY